MKKAFSLSLGIMALLMVAALVLPAGEPAVKDGQLAFTFPDLNDRPVSLSDARFKGKVVVVDIWGTWCPPCREQIPLLRKLDEKYGKDGLEIIGVAFERRGSQDEKIALLKKFVEENKIRYTVLFGGSSVAAHAKFKGLENFRAFPTTIFIGRDGKSAAVKTGFNSENSDDAEEIEKLVVELLKASK